MKRYIKTSWHYINFKTDFESTAKGNNTIKNKWDINAESLLEGLQDLSRYCNENSYKIKGIISIDKAHSSEHTFSSRFSPGLGSNGSAGGMGGGNGWGITITDGCAALLQYIEEMSDEEYARRIKQDQYDNLINDTNDQIQNIKNKSCKDMISAGIIEKEKGLILKKFIYIIGEQKFKTRIDAEFYLAKLKKDMKEQNDQISALSDKIDVYQKEKNNL